MKQHPIPQNILDIEFKLFTKFTVKEFVYIALGFGFGGIFLYLFTKAIIPAFIAIPIFIFSSGTGLFLGLVPINDQKADVFMTNFLRAIRKPTLRVWKNRSFDEKVEGMANDRGLTLTQGSLDRKQQDVAEKKDLKIIGGAAASMPANQFLEQQQIAILDQEEELKLQQIEALANANGLGTENGTAVQAEIEIPLPVEATIESDSLPIGGELSIEQKAEETIPSQPNQQQNVITLTNETITQYAIEIEGLVQLNNSINIQLVNKEGYPIAQATVMIKDQAGGLLQVIQSSQDGLVISNRSFSTGEYSVEIKHDQYTFPSLYYILEGMNYPPVRIGAI